MYHQEKVFISHAGPQRDVALLLRTQLRHAGISTFVDMRDLRPGQQDPAWGQLQAACQQAQLVVFVVTRDFLRQTATIQQLRWVLAQREQQFLAAGSTLPQLLTVLYPIYVLRSWQNMAELRQMLGSRWWTPMLLPAFAVAWLVNKALCDAPVDVQELGAGSLARLLHSYHPDKQANQAVQDLRALARLSDVRIDSSPRCSSSCHTM